MDNAVKTVAGRRIQSAKDQPLPTGAMISTGVAHASAKFSKGTTRCVDYLVFAAAVMGG